MSAPHWYAERGAYEEELRREWEAEIKGRMDMDYYDWLAELELDEEPYDMTEEE